MDLGYIALGTALAILAGIWLYSVFTMDPKRDWWPATRKDGQ